VGEIVAEVLLAGEVQSRPDRTYRDSLGGVRVKTEKAKP
jgi:hypothetical protein